MSRPCREAAPFPRDARIPFVRWECIVPSENHRKFYELRWVWSLFPLLERTWGRVGVRRPRRLIRSYPSPQEALDDLARLVARRAVRGYVLTAGADLLDLLSEGALKSPTADQPIGDADQKRA